MRYQFKDEFALNPQEIKALVETSRIICYTRLVSQVNLFLHLNFDMFILLVALVKHKSIIASLGKYSKNGE